MIVVWQIWDQLWIQCNAMVTGRQYNDKYGTSGCTGACMNILKKRDDSHRENNHDMCACFSKKKIKKNISRNSLDLSPWDMSDPSPQGGHLQLRSLQLLTLFNMDLKILSWEISTFVFTCRAPTPHQYQAGSSPRFPRTIFSTTLVSTHSLC